MFVLITYDVEAKRTAWFRKLLRRYLHHEQYSVFTGDLTEGELIRLRRELSRLMVPGDRVTQVIAANRRNVEIYHLVKDESGKGEVRQERIDDHRSDFGVL